ncbi:MAG: hypothetical protein Q8P18_03740 [Pseudomonadota bacterium]|nr:hypothetical protein [Pseudomonadota bacterium]
MRTWFPLLSLLSSLLSGCESAQVKLGDGTDTSDSGTEHLGDDTNEPAPATAPLYVHDATMLYTWDPATAAATPVGAFLDAATGAPLSYAADIAIDGEGQMFASSGTSIYRVDAATGETTFERTVSETGTGLTVLPDGRLLVAGAALTAWDLESGASEVIVAAGPLSTSGDVVAVPDGTLHWSVLGAEGDAWVVVDPSTGTLEERGSVGVSGLWGVAYAEGTLYGFSSSGGVYSIDGPTGQGVLVASSTVSFYGATTNPVTW